MSVTDELLAIERDLWTGGAQPYRDHLDADCLVAFAEMGGVYTPEAVAGMVEEGVRWREVEIEVEGVIQPTDDMALFTYLAKAVRGDDERHRARVSSGYVRREGGWKMAFHQQTPLAG